LDVFTNSVTGPRQDGAVSLVRSKKRVVDHGEVFTPKGIVDGMLGLIQGEAERIDSRFLEPACGSGNFLVPVLKRKLSTVGERYGKNEFEKRHHALLALMSIYGIELLEDNVTECQENLLQIFQKFIGSQGGDQWHLAGAAVVAVNIVHGDALSMRTQGGNGEPITFAEWSYLGKGQFQRRDFRFDTLTQMASFGEEDTLFADIGKHDIFTPVTDHGSMSVNDFGGPTNE
jgi:hypothetical protein